MDNPYEWRQPGEALWPENKSFTADQLRKIRASVGERDWQALYQGHPRAEGGEIFLAKHIAYWYPHKTEAPLPVRVDGQEQPQPLIQLPHDSFLNSYTLSGDLTFKGKNDSDFVALGVWATWGRYEILIDQIVGRKGFAATITAIASLLGKYPKIGAILIEDAANGPAVIETLKARLPGVIPRSAAGGKEARAHAISPRFEAGDILIPHPSYAPWVADYVRELCGFPRGANDDQVDQTTHYLAWRTERKGGLDRLLQLGAF